jgi:hypothetical protein
MNIICQTKNTLEEMKIYGINFFIEKDTIDKNGILYKVVHGIELYFNTKACIIGIGVPKFKATE